MTALLQRFIDDGDLVLAGRPVGPFAMNQYVLMDRGASAAAIVDAGAPPEAFQTFARAEGCTVDKILQTHAHVDHVAGLAETKRVLGVPIHLHPDDLPVYDHAVASGLLFGMKIDPPPPVDTRLAEGDVVHVGTIALRVMHTPGHAPGHVCFYAEEHGFILAGDLLFKGSIGRTDLPGCDPTAMVESLRRLFTLPDATRVFAGHMGPTTLGAERVTNPFVRDLVG